MKLLKPEYSPVIGKTYSLFGNSDLTLEYFETIRMLADRILEREPDINYLVDNLNKFSSHKRALRKILENKVSDNLMSFIISLTDPCLKKYTENTEEHLRMLPVSRLWDRRLATTGEQYHIYMLEIEFTNRLFAADFKRAKFRLSESH